MQQTLVNIKTCPYLNNRFYAATSNCKEVLLILPKITEQNLSCKLMWTGEIDSGLFGFPIQDYIFWVDLPDKYCLQNYLITPEKDKEIVLPLKFAYKQWDWVKPIFKETAPITNVKKDEELEYDY